MKSANKKVICKIHFARLDNMEIDLLSLLIVSSATFSKYGCAESIILIVFVLDYVLTSKNKQKQKIQFS